MVADFASSADLFEGTRVVVDRLIDDIRDIPSTCSALRALVEALGAVRTSPDSWQQTVSALRSDEFGRLLRTDPMVRRCQWRQNGDSAYDIAEAYVMGWGDAADSLFEAEPPGQTINSVFLAMGMGSAIRERRTMLHGFLAAAPRTARVLGLGVGRAPELAMLAPAGPLEVARWLVVDSDPSEDAIYRRNPSPRAERRVERATDALAAAAAKAETFDVIYAVDALDDLTDGEAVALAEQAASVLAPNGRFVLSAFAADLPEAAYLDAVLDWRPRLRDEAHLGQLLARAAGDAAFGRSVWRGGSDRVVFGSIERQSWAD